MSAPEVVLTSEEREALGDWWDSDWPDTAGGVMVTLYTAVEQIVTARLAAQAAEHEREVAGLRESLEAERDRCCGNLRYYRPTPVPSEADPGAGEREAQKNGRGIPSTKNPAWWPTAEQKRHADAGCAHPAECRVSATGERGDWTPAACGRCGRSLPSTSCPACFPATPDAGDVEALADRDVLALMRVLSPVVEHRRHYGLKIEDAEVYARAVLTSDWFASHDAATADRVRRETAEEIAAAIEARKATFVIGGSLDACSRRTLDLAARIAREAGR